MLVCAEPVYLMMSQLDKHLYEHSLLYYNTHCWYITNTNMNMGTWIWQDDLFWVTLSVWRFSVKQMFIWRHSNVKSRSTNVEIYKLHFLKTRTKRVSKLATDVFSSIPWEMRWHTKDINTISHCFHFETITQTNMFEDNNELEIIIFYIHFNRYFKKIMFFLCVYKGR